MAPALSVHQPRLRQRVSGHQPWADRPCEEVPERRDARGAGADPDRTLRRKRACGSRAAGARSTRNAALRPAPPRPETARCACGARTEHVRAVPRMPRRGPLRFLPRGPRRLLAQPELAVAGRPSRRSGLEVISEPLGLLPRRSLGSAALFSQPPA